MVKTTVDVEGIVRRLIDKLSQKVTVEHVFLTGDYAQDAATDDSDIELLVISPSFEGKDVVERTDILAFTALEVDVLIQAWGFTPLELKETLSGGENSIPVLGMMLNRSHEIYTNPRLA